MTNILDVLGPEKAIRVAAVLLGVATVYSLVRGRVFLLPYTVDRRVNPRAFYVLFAIIVGAFISALMRIFRG